MKPLYIFCLFALVFCTTSCKKYEPRYEGAWTDAKAGQGQKLNVTRNIVYVMPDGIWTTDGINAPKHVLTDNISVIKRVSISPKYDKIAFIKNTGSITVIDSNGAVLATLPNPNNIQHFEWYHNNNLLYGTQTTAGNRKIVALYGGTLPTLPTLTLTYSNEDLLFAYITKDNDIFYSSRVVNALARLYYKKSTGGSPIIKNDDTNYYYAPTDIRIGNNSTSATLFDNPTNYLYNVTLDNRSFNYSTSDYQSNTQIYFGDSKYVSDYLSFRYYDRADNNACYNGCPIADTQIFDVK